MSQSARELAEMIAKFRTPPGVSWEPLADDIETALNGWRSPGGQEAQGRRVLDMLSLCGERELEGISDPAEKLRALIDGLIAERARAEAADRKLAEIMRICAPGIATPGASEPGPDGR